jgi:uncharacterized protein YegL
MRRLPVYLLLDTSGGMYGEPIQALNNALSSLVNALRSDPMALDTVWLSIITFDRVAQELIPLTEVASFQLPEITCPQSGPRHTGRALELLYDNAKRDIIKGNSNQKGDWKPLLFLFTKGSPNDKVDFTNAVPKIKSLNFGAIVSCAAGYIKDEELLKQLSDNVVHLDNADSHTIKQFFKWVSETIEQGGKSQGTGESVTLPPPPQDVHLVI